MVVTCPSHVELEGKEFESGRSLKDQQGLNDATYEMVVTADPAFAPWDYTMARLSSTGWLKLEKHAFLVQIQWDGNAKVNASIASFEENDRSKVPNNLLWAIMEGDQKEHPMVILGVPPSLLQFQSSTNLQAQTRDHHEEEPSLLHVGTGRDLLPPPSKQLLATRLPASLLQKAIRRGMGMLCTSRPLVEASLALLKPSHPCRGATLAFLKTVWGSMLVDVAPFEDSEDCLGLPSLLLLSLVAKADPEWTLPEPLRRKALAAAFRTAASPKSQQWLGFVIQDDEWWELEDTEVATPNNDATHLRNILRVAQCCVGGRLAWGKWSKFTGDPTAAATMAYLNASEWNGSHLPPPPPQSRDESAFLDTLENGTLLSLSKKASLNTLDEECRLASVEPDVVPALLVLLQASISQPPTSWKKHSLPSLAKQVRKLITEANPRHQERVQLARLATWGKENARKKRKSSLESPMLQHKYKSFREVVTPTGTMSEKETEIVDCVTSIQKWYLKRDVETLIPQDPVEWCEHGSIARIEAGPPPSAYDGRVAFILAFGTAIEIRVVPDPSNPSKTEVVSAMFCGDVDSPLLVQRIGKAHREGQEMATAGGTNSGATAVPSLGYVQKERSPEEANIMKSAEDVIASHWRKGVTVTLPLPPVGIQWSLEDESNVVCSADFVRRNGASQWIFKIGNQNVPVFDARCVISSCALNLEDQEHQPSPMPESRMEVLRSAFYLDEGRDEGILEAMQKLHEFAEYNRDPSRGGISEGRVYKWLSLARESPIPARTWRDALLAIRTREKDHVVLGRGISQDGTGGPRDMVEGVLLRILHALEMLYPTVLKKDAAMRFRVRPRGAGYYHLLHCLQILGCSNHQVAEIHDEVVHHMRPSRKQRAKLVHGARPSKRPRRAGACRVLNYCEGGITDDDNDSECIPPSDTETEVQHSKLPKIKTSLWAHQEESVSKVVHGVKEGKRGHADASAVGAGKTLTALACIVRLAKWVEDSGISRRGVLIMLPTKALIREWLIEIATHTEGFHVIEQREDGSLFSLTYGKSHPPLTANALVISTLDRVSRHPFIRQTAWDFVVIDECLSVQNASAKRNPSAWRQIEVSTCGVLMLSATFFRSKYDQLFYMIRMLRSPLPRTIEWLSATIHEHIVCQIPETDRSWQMKGELVPLEDKDMQDYLYIINSFKRNQINRQGTTDGRKIWTELEAFLRRAYEGRSTKSIYGLRSVMSDAFGKVARSLLRKRRRPLIFADTQQEAEFLIRALTHQGLTVCSWASLAAERSIQAKKKANVKKAQRVIVAVKTVEGQGINMQHYADSIICRPTPGDHLEQMKGRIDRPGQTTNELLLVVLTAEHTIEEAKFANILLAGNFFREYIAPVASKYRERIDLEASLAVGSQKKLRRGTVSGKWKKLLEDCGRSGAFSNTMATDDLVSDDDEANIKVTGKRKSKHTTENVASQGFIAYKPAQVLRNKGDPEAVRQAKSRAKQGLVASPIQKWLFPAKQKRSSQSKGKKGLPKESLLRFSDRTPPLVLDEETVEHAVLHLSKNDPRLAALISRVGSDAALIRDCGTPLPPTQARLFDKILRAITFIMISVDAGEAFLRRLAMKVAVCVENFRKGKRDRMLKDWVVCMHQGLEDYVKRVRDGNHLLDLVRSGMHYQITFTPQMLQILVDECEVVGGKQTGFPHLCGPTFPCGKNDDPGAFLAKAREEPVSAGYSRDKAIFIVSLLADFASGKISGEKIAKASDREAARMLLELKGIGDWCAGGVLMHFLSRADVMLYGDLTVRNYLNDLYDISHQEESETLLESAADFDDTATNRNLIDGLAQRNGWAPYRSVVCYLMYHLQEENLVLL